MGRVEVFLDYHYVAPHPHCIATTAVSVPLPLAALLCSTSEDHNPTFWPFAKADSSEPKASAAHAEPQHGWPECWGKCVAGMCTLQHKEPGCCVLNKHSDHYENYYGGPYDAKADDDYHRGYDDDNLVCWDK